jgi:phage shock protein A
MQEKLTEISSGLAAVKEQIAQLEKMIDNLRRQLSILDEDRKKDGHLEPRQGSVSKKKDG